VGKGASPPAERHGYAWKLVGAFRERLPSKMGTDRVDPETGKGVELLEIQATWGGVKCRGFKQSLDRGSLKGTGTNEKLRGIN